MATSNITTAPAAQPATPVVPLMRALPVYNKVQVQPGTMLAPGKAYNARAPQTLAAKAAVGALGATFTAQQAHIATHQCSPPDPEWLGYALKYGWVVLVPAVPAKPTK